MASWRDYGKIHTVTRFAILLSCTVLGAIAAFGDEARLFKTVKEAQDAPTDAYRASAHFAFRGLITFAGKENFTIFEDQTGRIPITFDFPGQTNRPDAGSQVLVKGYTTLSKGRERRLYASSFAVTGRTAPPPPRELAVSQLLRGEGRFQVVRTIGTVVESAPDDVDANYSRLLLTDRGESIVIAVSAKRNRNRPVTNLVNAVIRVTGTCSLRQVWHNFSSPYITCEPSGIEVIQPAPANPFDIPTFSGDWFFVTRNGESNSRRRIQGHVLAVARGICALIRTEEGHFLRAHLSPGMRPPEPNEAVVIAGLVDPNSVSPLLRNAIWKSSPRPRSEAETPRNLSIQDLFVDRNGRPAIQYNHDGEAIRLQGTVLSLRTRDNSTDGLLIEQDGYPLSVDASGCPSAIAGIQIGSKVDVSGIGLIEMDDRQRGVALQLIRDVSLVLRTPEDIRVISTPPFLTVRKLTIAFCALLAALVGILVWNRTLAILVRRRSRELFRSQIAQAESQIRIDERTRLAAELHDYTAQNLTVVAYQISEARTALGDTHGASADRLDEAARTLKSCRTSLRRCLWDLRSDVLDEPDFAEAIRRTVVPVARKAKVSVRFEGQRSGLNDITAHAILSILRELAANAAAHGQAKSIRIAGECRPDGIRFSVQDDGCGFDPLLAPQQDEGHFGLDGIRERLEHLEGSLTIDSSPGAGTYVRLTLHTPQPDSQTT